MALTDRDFEELAALMKRRGTNDTNAALAELAPRATSRVRELARELLRFSMTEIFEKYLDFEEIGRRTWPDGAEFLLWSAHIHGPTSIPQETLDQIMALHIEAGGWWRCQDYDGALDFVSTETWLCLYDDWLKSTMRKL